MGGPSAKATKLLADLRLAVEQEQSLPPHSDLVKQAIDAIKSRQANSACDGLLKDGLKNQDNRTVAEWMSDLWKLKREEDRHLFLCYYFSRVSYHVGKAHDKLGARPRDFSLGVLNIMRHAILPIMQDLNMDVVSVEAYCARNSYGGEMMAALHTPGLLEDDAFEGADFSLASTFVLEEKMTLGEGSRSRTTTRRAESNAITVFPPLFTACCYANVNAVEHMISEHGLNGNENVAPHVQFTPMMALAVARATYAKKGKSGMEFVKRADTCRRMLEAAGGEPFDDCLPENKGSDAAAGKVKSGAGCHTKSGYGKAGSSSTAKSHRSGGDDSWFKKPHDKSKSKMGHGSARRGGTVGGRRDYDDEDEEDGGSSSRSSRDYDEEESDEYDDEYDPARDQDGSGDELDLDYSSSPPPAAEVSETRTAFSGKTKGGTTVSGATRTRTVERSRPTADGVVYQEYRQEEGILFVRPTKASSAPRGPAPKAIEGRGRAHASGRGGSSSSSSSSGPRTAADASQKRPAPKSSGSTRPYAGESKRTG